MPELAVPPALVFDFQDQPHIAYPTPDDGIAPLIAHTYRTTTWTPPILTGLYAPRPGDIRAGVAHMVIAADGICLAVLQPGPVDFSTERRL